MNNDQSLQSASQQIARAQDNKGLRPSIAGFFDEATNTVSYVVHDPKTSEAAIIDRGEPRMVPPIGLSNTSLPII